MAVADLAEREVEPGATMLGLGQRNELFDQRAHARRVGVARGDRDLRAGDVAAQGRVAHRVRRRQTAQPFARLVETVQALVQTDQRGQHACLVRRPAQGLEQDGLAVSGLAEQGQQRAELDALLVVEVGPLPPRLDQLLRGRVIAAFVAGPGTVEARVEQARVRRDRSQEPVARGGNLARLHLEKSEIDEQPGVGRREAQRLSVRCIGGDEIAGVTQHVAEVVPVLEHARLQPSQPGVRVHGRRQLALELQAQREQGQGGDVVGCDAQPGAAQLLDAIVVSGPQQGIGLGRRERGGSGDRHAATISQWSKKSRAARTARLAAVPANRIRTSRSRDPRSSGRAFPNSRC